MTAFGLYTRLSPQTVTILHRATSGQNGACACERQGSKGRGRRGGGACEGVEQWPLLLPGREEDEAGRRGGWMRGAPLCTVKVFGGGAFPERPKGGEQGSEEGARHIWALFAPVLHKVIRQVEEGEALFGHSLQGVGGWG